MPITPSPLRYPGGKTAYAEMLKTIIHQNKLEGCAYAEPFAGGAGAAITLLLDATVSEIWLNDLDIAIYSFWKAILHHTGDFLRMLSDIRITIDEWHKQKQIYLQKPDDTLALGFATFFLNRSNRAGILLANPVGGLSQAGEYKIDARFKKDKLAEKIIAIAAQGDQIHLFNLDAMKFLKVLSNASKKILVYFDPPYFKKGELLYLNHFQHNDHKKLSKKIVSCQLPWVLSYDDHPEVTQLYQDIPIYRKKLRYSVARPSVGQELIISKLALPDYLKRVETQI
ncbi:MAG: DNA adenine methylase [Candidatus Riflebacteria bacterium]|nr:DNA adenine methylase [Candidatus Riflebacteria bacterium]